MSEFGSLDLDEMAGEEQRLTSDGNQNNFLDQFVPMPDVKPGASGSVALRILPPIKGHKLYQYNRTHKMNSRSIHCPRPLTKSGKWDRVVACPICDYYSDLWRKSDTFEKKGMGAQAKELQDEARLIKPVERYYYNAIVRQLTDEDGKVANNVGPRILSVGKVLHKMIIRAIVGEEGDPDSKLGNITDLKAGYDFIIRKEVTTGDGYPKYDRSGFARNPSPAGSPDEVKAWAEALHDLTKLRNPKDFEYLEKELAIHRGLIADDSEQFSTENFDKKWAQKKKEEIQEMLEHTPGGVVVPAGVPTSKKTETAATKTETKVEKKPAPVEDLPIEDEDFLADLERMEG